MSLDPDRRRRPLAAAPPPGRRRQPRAHAGRQGQRLRLRPRPARPQGRVARRRHHRRRHLRGAARGRPALPRRPAGADAVATDRPGAGRGPAAGRVIHTVSRLADLVALLDRDPQARVVLERLTSMRRHGMSADELRAAAKLLERRPARVEGVAFHLPLAAGAHLSEVVHLVNDVVAAELPTRTLWVSHLTPAELATLRSSYADFEVRPRVGTSLWLGDRDALTVTATVLDVHEVERGDVFGYRGRTVPKAGHILVVSGGTAHGIGLESPTGDHSMRARAATLARGGLDAVGFVALAVHRRRQAPAVRRAAAHAGLDALPSPRPAGARGRRGDRRCGCATRSPRVRPGRRQLTGSARLATQRELAPAAEVPPRQVATMSRPSAPRRTPAAARRAPRSRPGRAARPPARGSPASRSRRRRRHPDRGSGRGTTTPRRSRRSRRPARPAGRGAAAAPSPRAAAATARTEASRPC